MIVSFDISTETQDVFRVVLSSGEDCFFAGKDVYELLDNKVEIVEIDLERISGNTPASINTLMKISEVIGNYFLQNNKAVLYYYCDDMNDIPVGNNRGLWPQQYRSELFGRMFQRRVRGMNSDIVDVIVLLQQESRPIYMHLIARSAHQKYIEALKDYIVSNYGK